MAKIICKSGYLRTQAHVLNLLEYAGNKIAYQELVYKDGACEKFSTNEKLEPKNPDRVQSVRIHFKDGAERVMDYSEYVYCITKTVTLDQVVGVEEDADPGVKQPHEMKDLDMMRYLGYIEGRPGVEKEDGHGLFGVSGDVPISVARQMAEQHSDSTIWSHIISMDEIEAKEKGYDQRSAWKDLVLALSPRIAKIYNITPENLVINAAFHNNTDNPHIHMMFYSTDPREGKVFGSREENEALKKASRQLKSLFVNSIFKPETRSIQESRGAAQEQLKEILRQQVAKELPGAVLEKYQAVAAELKQHSGRLEYGYLAPELKQQVNELLRDLVEQTPALAERSEAFLKMQEAYVRMYVNKEEIVAEQMERYKNEFFAPTKAGGKQANTVLHNILIKSMVMLEPGNPPAPELSSKEKMGMAFSDIEGFSYIDETADTVASGATNNLDPLENDTDTLFLEFYEHCWRLNQVAVRHTGNLLKENLLEHQADWLRIYKATAEAKEQKKQMSPAARKEFDKILAEQMQFEVQNLEQNLLQSDPLLQKYQAKQMAHLERHFFGAQLAELQEYAAEQMVNGNLCTAPGNITARYLSHLPDNGLRYLASEDSECKKNVYRFTGQGVIAALNNPAGDLHHKLAELGENQKRIANISRGLKKMAAPDPELQKAFFDAHKAVRNQISEIRREAQDACPELSSALAAYRAELDEKSREKFVSQFGVLVREAAGQAFSNGAFMLPQHNMILRLADNLDETFAQAAQRAATEQVKALRQEINRQYYKVFCLPKEKREAHALYKMLLHLPEQENLKVGAAQQILGEVLQTPEQKALYSAAFETFKAEYTRLGGEQDFLKTSAAFNRTILTGKYESVFSNLEFVRDNCEETIQRIEKQQLEQKVVSSCCLLARIMDTDARNQEQAAKRCRRFRKRHRHQERAQENSIER